MIRFEIKIIYIFLLCLSATITHIGHQTADNGIGNFTSHSIKNLITSNSISCHHSFLDDDSTPTFYLVFFTNHNGCVPGAHRIHNSSGVMSRVDTYMEMVLNTIPWYHTFDIFIRNFVKYKLILNKQSGFSAYQRPEGQGAFFCK